MSDLNDANMRPGRIGIVSKSGTLTYEVIEELHRHGLGESTVVCLGGDRVIGTHYVDVLRLFEDDPDTDLVVLIGEPGGGLEYAGRRSMPADDAHARRRLHHRPGQPAGCAHGPCRRRRRRRRAQPAAEQDEGVCVGGHRGRRAS